MFRTELTCRDCLLRRGETFQRAHHTGGITPASLSIGGGFLLVTLLTAGAYLYRILCRRQVLSSSGVLSGLVVDWLLPLGMLILMIGLILLVAITSLSSVFEFFLAPSVQRLRYSHQRGGKLFDDLGNEWTVTHAVCDQKVRTMFHDGFRKYCIVILASLICQPTAFAKTRMSKPSHTVYAMRVDYNPKIEQLTGLCYVNGHPCWLVLDTGWGGRGTLR